jgi:hypothetical protein
MARIVPPYAAWVPASSRPRLSASSRRRAINAHHRPCPGLAPCAGVLAPLIAVRNTPPGRAPGMAARALVHASRQPRHRSLLPLRSDRRLSTRPARHALPASVDVHRPRGQSLRFHSDSGTRAWRHTVLRLFVRLRDWALLARTCGLYSAAPGMAATPHLASRTRRYSHACTYSVLPPHVGRPLHAADGAPRHRCPAACSPVRASPPQLSLGSSRSLHHSDFRSTRHSGSASLHRWR